MQPSKLNVKLQNAHKYFLFFVLQQWLSSTCDGIWRPQIEPKVPCLMHRCKWRQDLANLLAMVGFLVSCNLVNQGKNLWCSGLGLGVGNIVLQQMQGLRECYFLEKNLWHLWENLLLQNPLLIVFFLASCRI